MHISYWKCYAHPSIVYRKALVPDQRAENLKLIVSEFRFAKEVGSSAAFKAFDHEHAPSSGWRTI